MSISEKLLCHDRNLDHDVDICRSRVDISNCHRNSKVDNNASFAYKRKTINNG